MARKGTIPNLRSIPVLPVHDMPEAIGFYRRLGLAVDAFNAEYALVLAGGHEQFHLRLVPDLLSEANEAGAYLHVDAVEPLHAAWSGVVTILDDLGDRPWGMREFSFVDHSGNLIRVGHSL